jgi:hypothetical protein
MQWCLNNPMLIKRHHKLLFWELIYPDKWNHASSLTNVTYRISSPLAARKPLNHKQYCTRLQFMHWCYLARMQAQLFWSGLCVNEYETPACCDSLRMNCFGLCIMQSEITCQSTTVVCYHVVLPARQEKSAGK